MVSEPRLQDLVIEAQATPVNKTNETLISLSKRIKAISWHDDEESAAGLGDWIAQHILPNDAFSFEPSSTDGARLNEKLLQQRRQAYEAGLESLQLLDELFFSKKDASHYPPKILMSFLAFTDQRDLWTTQHAYEVTEELIAKHLSRLLDDSFLVDYILRDQIRSLFSTSKPEKITEQGRKNLTSSSPSTSYGLDLQRTERRAWKHDNVAAVTIFGWILTHVSFVPANWPLLVPPLLAILDDGTSEVRARGLELLQVFLNKAPGKMLSQTGLAEVFEDTVMPTLLFLPSLTPEEESLRMLRQAYKAMFALSDVLSVIENERGSRKSQERLTMAFLGRLLMNGVVQGYSHCPENISIVQLLLENTILIVDKMGINAVAYLKHITPMIVAVLSDPFAVTHLPLIQQCLQTTQVVLLNCWPRIQGPQSRMIIQALITCWYGISEEANPMGAGDATSGNTAHYRSSIIESTRHKLQVTVDLFVTAVKQNSESLEEISTLTEADPRLQDLFRLSSLHDLMHS